METIYDKLQRCLHENKKYLGDDGYIQLEKSPRIKVGLGEYGRKLFKEVRAGRIMGRRTAVSRGTPACMGEYRQ